MFLIAQIFTKMWFAIFFKQMKNAIDFMIGHFAGIS